MLAGGAMNLVSAGRAHLRREIRARADSLADRLDLVPREDFQNLERLVVRLREEQEVLKTRLAVLESSRKPAVPGPTPARRGKKPS